MGENIKSEMISRRGAFSPFWLGGGVEPCRASDGYDRYGCRSRRWSSGLTRERCWRESARSTSGPALQKEEVVPYPSLRFEELNFSMPAGLACTQFSFSRSQCDRIAILIVIPQESRF